MTLRPIPDARNTYVQSDEQTVRRQIEQNFRDLSVAVDNTRAMDNKVSSLSVRRFQFLLMGASHG